MHVTGVFSTLSSTRKTPICRFLGILLLYLKTCGISNLLTIPYPSSMYNVSYQTCHTKIKSTLLARHFILDLFTLLVDLRLVWDPSFNKYCLQLMSFSYLVRRLFTNFLHAWWKWYMCLYVIVTGRNVDIKCFIALCYELHDDRWTLRCVAHPPPFHPSNLHI